MKDKNKKANRIQKGLLGFDLVLQYLELHTGFTFRLEIHVEEKIEKDLVQVLVLVKKLLA